MVDVLDGFCHAVHHPNIQDVIVIFGVVILVFSMAQFDCGLLADSIQNGLRFGVHPQFDVLRRELGRNAGQEGRSRSAINSRRSGTEGYLTVSNLESTRYPISAGATTGPVRASVSGAFATGATCPLRNDT